MTIADLSDDELLNEVARLAGDERSATARLIVALAEIDARRLYLGQGFSSLFVYCTRALHLSEHAADGRIEAARVARRFPVVLEMLEQGDLTLTVCLLAPHVTDSNHLDLPARARHRSKREVEEIVAGVRPRPDALAAVRKLPDRLETKALAPDTVEHAELSAPPTLAPPPMFARPAAAITPLAPSRYKLQLTIDRPTKEKLYLARDLMRHAVPSGDLAAILNRALDALLKQLQRRKSAAAGRPRPDRNVSPDSRHIPAAVRRAVWARDGGRCAFRAPGGSCGETAFIEFHHVRPFAAGGGATIDNIELRCRAHNQYEAELFVDELVVVRESRAAYRTSAPAGAARSAGTSDAVNAAHVSPQSRDRKGRRISWPDVVQQARHHARDQRRSDDAADDADQRHPDALPHHHGYDVAPIGAERHSNADFVRPLDRRGAMRQCAARVEPRDPRA